MGLKHAATGARGMIEIMHARCFFDFVSFGSVREKEALIDPDGGNAVRILS